MSKPKTAAKKKTAVTTTPKLTYQNRMRQLTPIARLTAKLASTMDRFGHLVTEVSAWKNAAELATSAKVAFTAIEQFSELVSTLPTDFAVERARKSSVSSLTPGMFVNLKEKVGEAYDGVLDGADRIRLEVLNTRKGRVVCKTAGGEKIILPRGHVEIAPAIAAPKAKKKAEAA